MILRNFNKETSKYSKWINRLIQVNFKKIGKLESRKYKKVQGLTNFFLLLINRKKKSLIGVLVKRAKLKK